MGSGNFDPNKLSNWNYEVRRPLIAANPGTYRNIYAPSVVLNGNPQPPHTWNVYFGGWDGTSENPPHDKISLLISTDDFLTLSNHAPQISNGVFEHVNNPSVQKISGNQWLMYYTTIRVINGTPEANKTAYSTSTDGGSWNPNSGTMASRLTMQGYPYDWNSTDVNGGNALYYENGIYHLYFIDLNNSHSFGVHHATSTNGVNYTYQNTIPGQRAVNDLKPFWFNGIKYFLMASADIGSGAYASVSTDLTSFPPATHLFGALDSNDASNTGVSLVTNGSRLYGILYGAAPASNWLGNAIYASWLQKKVLFINDYVRWGDIERAYGPDRIKLFLNTQVETGRFYVYDTDGTTLLYTSPRVTIRSGDLWQYGGG